MRGIDAVGFTTCTPIQEKTLPEALAGADVAGQAQTGTGKTAAFLISTFTRLLRNEAPGTGPRALIIAPTRELVVQILHDAEALGPVHRSDVPGRVRRRRLRQAARNAARRLRHSDRYAGPLDRLLQAARLHAARTSKCW